MGLSAIGEPAIPSDALLDNVVFITYDSTRHDTVAVTYESPD